MIKTTDYKVTALFCIIDDFCQHFEAENAGKLLVGEDGVRRRRRKASLSDSEIMTILLYFHFGCTATSNITTCFSSRAH